MEFMLIIAGVLVLFLPIIYILADYSLEAGSDAREYQLNSMAERIVDESREIYYLGLFSKQIITVKVPDGVYDMSSYIINKSGTYENYLSISYYTDQGAERLLVPSEVPIITSDCNIDNTIASGCGGAVKCYACAFDPADYAEGSHNFQLKTLGWHEMIAVNMTQVTAW